MKILIDPQIFNDQVFGGISRYYTEIFSKFAQNDDVIIENPILITKNVYFKKSVLFGKQQKKYAFILKSLSILGISVRKKTRNVNFNLVKKLLSNQDFDIFIPTYYNPYFLEYIENKPFVLTVYDMIHELFPQYFNNDEYNVIQNKKVLIEKATKIIAVSNNTKKDILKIYPHIDASKIEVIYHGSSIEINKIKKVAVPERYILYVGDRRSYKNFIFFVHSIQNTLLNDPSLKVLCAGGGNFDAVEIKMLEKLNIKNQVVQKNFIDLELAYFYKNALCFVFPSEYEGFGIPVLEAMACGCPIVLTNNSSFPEVAGDAGIFFELNNAEDLKNKIENLLQNESLRKAHSEKGLEQIKKFDWNNASIQCLKVYKDAIVR